MSKSQGPHALYYPRKRLTTAAWLRSQLLYFDKINAISSPGEDLEPTLRDEAELIEHGLVVRCSPTDAKAMRSPHA